MFVPLLISKTLKNSSNLTVLLNPRRAWYRLSVAFLHIKFLFGFKQKFWKERLKVRGTNSSESSSMVLMDSLRIFRFDKIRHHLRLYCTVTSITSKLYSISLFNSGILLQQPITRLKGVSVLFRISIAPS